VPAPTAHLTLPKVNSSEFINHLSSFRVPSLIYIMATHIYAVTVLDGDAIHDIVIGYYSSLEAAQAECARRTGGCCIEQYALDTYASPVIMPKRGRTFSEEAVLNGAEEPEMSHPVHQPDELEALASHIQQLFYPKAKPEPALEPQPQPVAYYACLPNEFAALALCTDLRQLPRGSALYASTLSVERRPNARGLFPQRLIEQKQNRPHLVETVVKKAVITTADGILIPYLVGYKDLKNPTTIQFMVLVHPCHLETISLFSHVSLQPLYR
jgi:hypothetical protein